MAAVNLPTLERVRQILDYDPETGIFTRRVSQGKWKAGQRAGTVNNGYIQINVDGRLIYGHRVAWFITHGSWPKDQIDHINRNRTDNRLANLRGATNGQNTINRLVRPESRSGIKGVRWLAANRKWEARIAQRYLGLFQTKEEASAAYRAAAIETFGEFALLEERELS